MASLRRGFGIAGVALNFKSFGQILQETLDYLASVASPLTDFNIGSAGRSFLEAVALVLAELHYLSQQLISRFFVSTAAGQWLDMRAAEYGLVRVLDTPTTRVLTVTHGAGTPSVTIPVGQQFGTLPGAAVQVVYQVTQQTILAAGAGSASVPAISTTTGAATAIPAATVLRQQGTALAYLDTIVTGAVTLAGTDRETDDALRARLLDHIRHPAGPGSPADYTRAVLDRFSATIASVAVIGLWAGPGTVEVLVLGPDNALPTGGQVADVQAYLDTWAPIGAAVTVAAPATVAVDVQVTLAVAPGADAPTVRANAQAAVAGYLNGLGVGEAARFGAVADAVWRTSGVGGPTGRDGGTFTGLGMRTGGAGYGATDVLPAATAKVVAGVIAVS